jgi:hypothetical protein
VSKIIHIWSCPRDSYTQNICGKRKVGRPKSRWPVEVNGDARKLGIILCCARPLYREEGRKRLLEDEMQS